MTLRAAGVVPPTVMPQRPCSNSMPSPVFATAAVPVDVGADEVARDGVARDAAAGHVDAAARVAGDDVAAPAA